jgi:inorganic pyrophosphatase
MGISVQRCDVGNGATEPRARAELLVDVVVETPTGSRNKYERDHRSGVLRLDRRLPSATVFPADYGYVERTLARDRDPLDALVLVQEPTFPGCVITARILGLFNMSDEAGPDSKLITVPAGDPFWAHARDLGDIVRSKLDEIEHFFDTYKDLQPGRETVTDGFAGADQAVAELESSRRRFLQRESNERVDRMMRLAGRRAPVTHAPYPG